LKKYEKEFAKELEKLPAEHKKRIAKSSKVISSILASQNKLS
jgi:mRNA-degrading endonuclease RelE of RelBE toxin-antitoxin system